MCSRYICGRWFCIHRATFAAIRQFQSSRESRKLMKLVSVCLAVTFHMADIYYIPVAKHLGLDRGNYLFTLC